MLEKLPDGYNAVVIGSTGKIGSAILKRLKTDARCANAIGLSRHTAPAVDYNAPASLQDAAKALKADLGTIHFLFIATGILASSDGASPEKAFSQLTLESLSEEFAINAAGPALTLSAFMPLLPRKAPCIVAALSARVGSIGDNGLGGWISYRASKAALNQIMHTAAIELGRKNDQAVCVSLHPGTIESELSRPFARDRFTHTADECATNLLGVLSNLTPDQNGCFFDYAGEEIVW